MTLPVKIQGEIDRVAAEGNALCDQGRFAEALPIFRKGLEILPKPVHQWPRATFWFLTAIGDCQFFLKDFRSAVDTFSESLLYGGLGNEFVHMRRGQALFELGDRKESANELLRALLLGGVQAFVDEDEKYLQFVTSVAKPPAGRSGWKGFSGVEKSGPVYEWLMDPGAYEFRPKPQKK